MLTPSPGVSMGRSFRQRRSPRGNGVWQDPGQGEPVRIKLRSGDSISTQSLAFFGALFTPEEWSPVPRSKWSTAENHREKASFWPYGLPAHEVAVQGRTALLCAGRMTLPMTYCGPVTVFVTDADCAGKYGSDRLRPGSVKFDCGRLGGKNLRPTSTKGVMIRP